MLEIVAIFILSLSLTFNITKFLIKRKNIFNIHCEDIDSAKQTIVLFGGLLENAKHRYRILNMTQYNAIYVTILRMNTLKSCIKEISRELPTQKIDYIYGYSFGGVCALELRKRLKIEKRWRQEPKLVLISSGGFRSYKLFEIILSIIYTMIYIVFPLPYTYMYYGYPTYWNRSKPKNDIIFVSMDDQFHNRKAIINNSRWDTKIRTVRGNHRFSFYNAIEALQTLK